MELFHTRSFHPFQHLFTGIVFQPRKTTCSFIFLLRPLDLRPLSIFPLRSPNTHLPCENSTSPFRSNHTLSALGSFPGDAAVFHCSLLLHLFLCITVCQLLLCKVFGEKFLSYSESNSRTLNSSRHIVGAQLKHRVFFVCLFHCKKKMCSLINNFIIPLSSLTESVQSHKNNPNMVKRQNN